MDLNLNVRGMGPSATVAINDHSDELLALGRDVCKLGLGQSPFPVPEPVVEALRRSAREKAYLPTRGLDELRTAVAGYHRRSQDLSVDAADVLIGPGSKELMFLLQLVYYGDIIIPTPAWVSYAPQAQIIGRHVSWVRTHPDDGWRLTPEQFDHLCDGDPDRPRILVLNYPSNPTGCTYSRTELTELADLARSYGVLVLSDEIYSELHHEGRHWSIARAYPEGTIVSAGLSKWCGAGGWRLGTFAFPPALAWLRESIVAVASETYTSTAAPIQYAAITAFDGGPVLDDYLTKSRAVVRVLGRWISEHLDEAGIRTARPEGAFYVFPDFVDQRDVLAKRGIRTSTELCTRMLDEIGVATLPGAEFGRPPDELTVRIAYVDFDGGRALDAVAALGGAEPDEAFLRSHCPAVLGAVDRICDWAVG